MAEPFNSESNLSKLDVDVSSYAVVGWPMKLTPYLPTLTIEQAEHCFMPPADICELAAVGDVDQKEHRRFLNNVSDRGHIPFKKSGDTKTSPRHYSAISAIMIRTIREVTGSGRTYEFAAPIAKLAGDTAKKLINECDDLSLIDENDWFIRYSSNWKGESAQIKVVRSVDFTPVEIAVSLDVGILSVGSIIWNTLNRYTDYWARDRQNRGVSIPLGRYDGFDDQGIPLDPAHNWNADLPPLERAKRLVEIEEFIERREAKVKGGRK